MTLPNEGHRHGVPTNFDWYEGPIHMDLDALPADTIEKFHAIVGWGQVYEAQEGSQSQNTRFQIRHLRTYYRKKAAALTAGESQEWLLADYGVVDNPNAAWFFEAFTDSKTRPSDHFVLPEEMGGGLSAALVHGS